MRDHSNHKSADRWDVIDALLNRTHFERRTEIVPVAQANGRVVAKTYTSTIQLPNKLTCKMDAIAVHYADFEQGEPDVSTWKRGVQWKFSNTGIAMPDDYDTAIAIENIELDENEELVAITKMPREKFDLTRPVGSTVEPGDVLVKEGETLSPTLLGVLNMGGHIEVEILAKPKVAFIPTGSELVPASANVPEGKNVESNATMVCAKLEQWGAEAVRFPIIPDDPEAILSALRKACAECDIVAINAGSSKGSDDWTCEVLEREGEVLFHEALQAPGKHSSFSVLDGKPVIGISGPPFAAELNADVFLKPFVDAYLGRNMHAPIIQARMLDSNPMSPRRVTIVKRACVARTKEGEFVAWLTPDGDRPKMRGCAQANALLFLDRKGTGYQEGDLHPVELMHPYTLPPLAEG